MAMWHYKIPERKGWEERSSRQFRVRTCSDILSLANVPQAEGKILLTRNGVGEKRGEDEGKTGGKSVWQWEGAGRRSAWSYPAELGSKSIGHKNAEKSNCDGDDHKYLAAPHFPLPVGSLGFPTFPPPRLLTNTPGCDPPAGTCGDLCLDRFPARGLLLLRTRRPRTPASPRSCKRRGRRLLAHLPRLRAPSPLRCAARAYSSTPAEWTFVSRGTFCLVPSSASRGDRPPPETRTAAKHRGGGWRCVQRRSPSDTHTPPRPAPPPEMPLRPGVRAVPQGRRHCASLSQLPGRACASRTAPAARPGPRPRSARGLPGGRESPAQSPASNSPASAGT